ncbi:unnamed protein product, partial [Rotaria sordida]
LESWTVFKAEFLHTYSSPTLKQLASHRLRNRQQHYDEPVIEYYADVTKLCKIIDPSMTDVSKTDHLYHGLKSSLMKEVFGRAPTTPSEFLEQARQEETLDCLVSTSIYQLVHNDISADNQPNNSYSSSTRLREPLHFQNLSNMFSSTSANAYSPTQSYSRCRPQPSPQYLPQSHDSSFNKSKYWVKEATFNNASEVEASIGNTWSKYYTNYTENGRKVYYRYKKAKHHGPQCSSSIYLLYHADSDNVTIYKTEADHDHRNNELCGIDENIKKIIEELYNDGIMRPKLIIRALQSRRIKVLTLGELEQWCKNNLDIPIDENTAFVVSYKVLYDDEEYEDVEDGGGNKFRVFISSIRLLNIASMSQHIHADATYKLIWQRFPVLVPGTTNSDKTFHPFGLAICSNEKTK